MNDVPHFKRISHTYWRVFRRNGNWEARKEREREEKNESVGGEGGEFLEREPKRLHTILRIHEELACAVLLALIMTSAIVSFFLCYAKTGFPTAYVLLQRNALAGIDTVLYLTHCLILNRAC